MLLTTGSIDQPHDILGIVNATSHLMLDSETIDAFESMDQLFSDVEEKMKQKAEEEQADGIINISFNTQVVQLQVAPKFLVITGYGTLVKFTE
ncbi:heavy metal-binding domain-containing protein [Paucilactobacillus sp. N302-9]